MFKEFALEILFNISTTKGIDKGKLAFCENGEYDFVGRQVDNYGIQGTLNALNFPANPKNTFSLVQVGNSLARFRERAWYASQNIFILKPTDNRIIDNHLYFEAILNKIMSKYGDGYSNYPTLKSLELELIKLPVIESPDPSHAYTVDDIDWQYMRDYITEIERDYITEIDTYLKVTGLDDYELTDEDKKTLADAKTHALGNFKVKDILPPIKVKKYASKPMTEGNVPFVSCQSTNNGIAVYCDETPEIRHCITVSTNGNCFDCFWHDYPIIPSSDVEVLSKDGITDDREISLYLCGALAPNTKLYSYSNKPKNGKVFDTIVSLPVVKSPDPSHAYTVDDIDWDFMKRYIRAIEKQTIADVVRFRDRELAVTRHVVGVA